MPSAESHTPPVRMVVSDLVESRSGSAKLARKLVDAGADVVYLSTISTAAQIRSILGKKSNLFLLDATGYGPPGVAFGPDVFYVDSPTKLEKIALLIRRLHERLKGAHFIIDHVDAIAQVNGEGPTMELIHLLCNQSAGKKSTLYFIFTDSSSSSAMMSNFSHLAGPPVALKELIA